MIWGIDWEHMLVYRITRIYFACWFMAVMFCHVLFQETPEAKRAARAFLKGAEKRGELRAVNSSDLRMIGCDEVI